MKENNHKKATKTTDRRIISLIKKYLFMFSRSIAVIVNDVASSRTVRMRTQAGNLLGRRAKRLPLLRPHHLRTRQKFARGHLAWKESERPKKLRNPL